VARLRRVNCSGPGIARRRRGRGFEYLDEHGRRVEDPQVLSRIRELVIPPAWQDVWICPYPMGHIQATGIDAAGRKQYRYHDRWRERQDRAKFDSMCDFGRALPELRERAIADLALPGMPRERALACAVRLLDRGFFRIGSEGYAEDNDTYGLATIRKAHVRLGEDGTVHFDYAAKGSKRQRQRIVDEDVYEVVKILKSRRGGGPELLAYKAGGRWRDVKSADINGYVKLATGGEFTAKDFRTWNATVIAAMALAVAGPAASGSRSSARAIKRAVDEVAHYLGNTPAVCRASYIDPRIFDRFDGGLTIGGVLPKLVEEADEWPLTQRSVEEAVLDLIAGHEDSFAVERVA
jgi:DNA topoisomerase I